MKKDATQPYFKAKWSTFPLILFQLWCQKLQAPRAPFTGLSDCPPSTRHAAT